MRFTRKDFTIVCPGNARVHTCLAGCTSETLTLALPACGLRYWPEPREQLHAGGWQRTNQMLGDIRHLAAVHGCGQIKQALVRIPTSAGSRATRRCTFVQRVVLYTCLMATHMVKCTASHMMLWCCAGPARRTCAAVRALRPYTLRPRKDGR